MAVAGIGYRSTIASNKTSTLVFNEHDKTMHSTLNRQPHERAEMIGQPYQETTELRWDLMPQYIAPGNVVFSEPQLTIRNASVIHFSAHPQI